METITYKQYDMAISRQVNKNLKERGTSTANCTMQDQVAREVFVETRPEEKIIIVKPNWREIIKLKK